MTLLGVDPTLVAVLVKTKFLRNDEVQPIYIGGDPLPLQGRVKGCQNGVVTVFMRMWPLNINESGNLFYGHSHLRMKKVVTFELFLHGHWWPLYSVFMVILIWEEKWCPLNSVFMVILILRMNKVVTFVLCFHGHSHFENEQSGDLCTLFSWSFSNWEWKSALVEFSSSFAHEMCVFHDIFILICP